MKYIPNAMKFGNQSRSFSLILNMIFEIVDLDPKLKTWTDSDQDKSNMLIINWNT